MNVQNANTEVFDLCIIGAGPLGIITTLEYAKLNKNKKIILIEFGKKKIESKNSLDESIEISNSINHHTPYESTNKGLGGSSATWGGRCVNYDEVDFIDRPIINNGCTWDISFFEEVKPYLKNAAEYFECGNPDFNLDEVEEFKTFRISENFKSGDITDSTLERWSMPTRFGKRYSKELEENESILLLEGYEVQKFSDPDKSGNISSLVARNTYSNEVLNINAIKFVLSAGTQETTRILLKNKNIFKNLPNVPNALGKYYQGHISGKIASVKFYGDPKKTDYGFMRDSSGIYLRRRFQFTKEFLVENNLLNTAIWLDNPLYFDPIHKNGAMSFMYLAMITPFIGKKLAPPAIAHSITKGKVVGLSGHFFNLLKDFPKSIAVPVSIFYKRYLLNRKLPGVFLYSPQNKYALHFHAEQIPDESNKMTLSNNGETLKIDYDIKDGDINSVIELHKRLDSYLREINCGELEYWYQPKDLFQAIKNMSKDGIHQSGTTRIGRNADEGVVDRNLLVFGTSNLYICSCSVLPTSSQANPTFFGGALAVRLSNQL